ncbi:AMP-binding enzyme [Actinomadura nitritigenes]|uniref:AMP-binding enzyme n=1 Tax=Actinomadura nitritigenes TaxID=134602 RepID=UPI003D8DE750
MGRPDGHSAVTDCAVVGVPDERWGETPKALVVLSEDVPEQQIIDYCRERLAHFKCPTSVERRDEIPRNPTGKILKRELRAPYWQGRDRGVPSAHAVRQVRRGPGVPLRPRRNVPTR